METTLDLVLEGRVLLIEKDLNGNIIQETVLPGDAVLQALISVIVEHSERILSEVEEETEEPTPPFQFTYG